MQDQPPSVAGQRLSSLYLFAAIAGLVLLLPLFGARTYLVLDRFYSLPGDNAFPESCIAQAVVWAAKGEPVYRALDGASVAPMLYGPLTYYVPAWVGRALDTTTPEALRHIARTWSFACYILAGLLLAEVAASLRRRSGKPAGLLTPLGAALLFWIFHPTPELSVTTRCDAPYLLANLMTVRLLMAFDDRDGAPIAALFGLGAMILLSASIRQIVFAPPATICLWLLARGRWKVFVAFCVAVPACGLALVWAGDRAWGHFIENVVKAGAVEFRLSFMREHFEEASGYLLLMTLPAIVWAVRSWGREARPSAFSIYAIASLPFAFLLAGKKGSGIGYYWETLAASAPLAAIAFEEFFRDAIAWFKSERPKGAPLPAGVAALAAMAIFASVELGALAGNNLLGLIREPYLGEEEVAAELRAIQSWRAEAEVAALPLRWNSLRADLPFLSADLFQHDLIVAAGQVTWAPVVAVIAERRYPVLLVDEPTLAQPEYREAWDALHAHYQRDYSRGDYGFWRANPATE
jgi:hypothetical protein